MVIEPRFVQFWSEIMLAIMKSRVWFQPKLHSTQFNYHYLSLQDETSLFNLHHLCFKYFFTRSQIVQFKEDLTVITTLNHAGYFCNYFVEFYKRIKMLVTSLGPSVLGKTLPSFLSTFFSQYGPSGWWITFIYYYKMNFSGWSLKYRHTGVLG